MSLILVAGLAGCMADAFDDRPALDGGDLAALPLDGAVDGGPPVSIASGMCTGRLGYACGGSVDLLRYPDGAVAVSLGTDFSVSDVPGTRLVLSGRDSLGRALDLGGVDLDLGPWRSGQGPGARLYPVREGDGGRRRVFVYGSVLGIEAGRAILVEGQ